MILDNVISDHYGPRTAESYDSLAKELFWAYSTTLEAISSEVLLGYRDHSDVLPSFRHFLDIGCGTGNVAHQVLVHNRSLMRTLGQGIPEPEIYLTSVDGSAPMLKAAEKKLESFEKVHLRYFVAQATKIAEDFSNERFDCIVSAFCIHHLNENEKRSLIGGLYRLLTPGGILVIGDRMPPEAQDRRCHDDYMNVIGAHLMKICQDRAERPSLSLVIADVLRQFREDGDQPSSVEKHLQWFKEAGFDQVRNSFFSFGCGVVAGRKAVIA